MPGLFSAPSRSALCSAACCLALVAQVICSPAALSADVKPSDGEGARLGQAGSPRHMLTRDEHLRRSRRSRTENAQVGTVEVRTSTLSNQTSGLKDAMLMPTRPTPPGSNGASNADPTMVQKRQAALAEGTFFSTVKADLPTPAQRSKSQTLTDSSALLLNHGGPIMPMVVTKNIFWGTSWAGYTGDKMTGLDSLCNGFGNSSYLNAAAEYTGSNGEIGGTVIHEGHVVDTSQAAGGDATDAILSEVCKMIPDPDPSGNGFYSVFTDVPRPASVGYCAYHSNGNCSGVQVQFGFFWHLDNDTGCNPQSQEQDQSEGLAALANVYAHELMEARTDPSMDGWLDASGQENGDKCAWSFKSQAVTLSDGRRWRLQSEWSNKAYLAGTGFSNRDGERGCIDGA